MSRTLFTSNGTTLELGRELGRGGEGAVYEVSSLSEQVAKLYHSSPDEKKQAKLSYMASIADSKLLNYVAWPQVTLHSSRRGPIVGFLMPKVTGRVPIHEVYSPAHRRYKYPKEAWDFLLYVSRNIAASFETIHEHGHVIGDVNQSCIMVGRDSRVMIIDSDSFQINASGTLHLCKVGVPHFTPPEMQFMSSFDTLIRTTNHDNFALALLLFHVLFGGRHPFSGVPLRKNVGDVLESDIKHFRYAYARDNQSRGISPPPSSIPISILPETMESMFHLAFTQLGASGTRPTAQQWVVALDEIRRHLRKCSDSGMHIYPDHLTKCPWCALEKQGVVYFVDLGTIITPKSSGFILTQVWGYIQAVPAPPAVSIPSTLNFDVKPRPLPGGIPGKSTIALYKLVVVAVAIAIVIAAPSIWIIALIEGCVGWMLADNAGSSKRKAETLKRRSTFQEAKREYDQLMERAQKEAGPEGFNALKAEFANLRQELEDLPRSEKQEINRLQATAKERQKMMFLETCYIDNANIPGIGPARKATLRSFGIETAADVNRNRVMSVSGFGQSLTRAILDWKASCERQFKFNPAAAVTAAHRNTIKNSYTSKRVTLERKLTSAPAQLQAFHQKAVLRLASMKPQLEAATVKLAQAQADLSIL